MPLPDIQKIFQDSVLTENLLLSLNYINESKDRLWIYLDAYQTRLIDALEKIFPITRAEMGEKKFYRQALKYIKLYPSEHYSLALLGRYFSQSLALPYRETAKIEWAVNIASDSPDCLNYYTRAQLEKIPHENWGDLIFVFHSSVTILSTHRVWRKQRQVYTLTILPEEKLFLTSVQSGKTLGEACEILYTVLPEASVVNYVIEQLLRWLEDEMIISAIIKENA